MSVLAHFFEKNALVLHDFSLWWHCVIFFEKCIGFCMIFCCGIVVTSFECAFEFLAIQLQHLHIHKWKCGIHCVVLWKNILSEKIWRGLEWGVSLWKWEMMLFVSPLFFWAPVHINCMLVRIKARSLLKNDKKLKEENVKKINTWKWIKKNSFFKMCWMTF